MDDGEPAITVASQVSIPDQDISKRRASSPTLHPSKRQRQSSPRYDRRLSPPQALPPTRRALSPTSKNRSKRMFGTLLTTISKFQSELDSPRAKAGSRKRKELEEKGRERARLQEEEEYKKEGDSGKEWREWERECLKTKHSALRNTAKFLVTKAKPAIYFLPYELREEDKLRLEERGCLIEEQIAAEQRDLEQRLALFNEEAKKTSKEGDLSMALADEDDISKSKSENDDTPGHDEDPR